MLYCSPAASPGPFLIPTPSWPWEKRAFWKLGSSSLGTTALGVRPSGPGERPTLGMQGKETNKRGKGRVDKAMLPTGGRASPRRARAGSRSRPQSAPVSQDRGSHGVVRSIHLTWAPAQKCSFSGSLRGKRWRWGLALVVLTSSPGASEAPRGGKSGRTGWGLIRPLPGPLPRLHNDPLWAAGPSGEAAVRPK